MKFNGTRCMFWKTYDSSFLHDTFEKDVIVGGNVRIFFALKCFSRQPKFESHSRVQHLHIRRADAKGMNVWWRLNSATSFVKVLFKVIIVGISRAAID